MGPLDNKNSASDRKVCMKRAEKRGLPKTVVGRIHWFGRRFLALFALAALTGGKGSGQCGKEGKVTGVLCCICFLCVSCCNLRDFRVEQRPCNIISTSRLLHLTFHSLWGSLHRFLHNTRYLLCDRLFFTSSRLCKSLGPTVVFLPFL
jgi:hypothetical protein